MSFGQSLAAHLDTVVVEDLDDGALAYAVLRDQVGGVLARLVLSHQLRDGRWTESGSDFVDLWLRSRRVGGASSGEIHSEGGHFRVAHHDRYFLRAIRQPISQEGRVVGS